MKTETLVAQWRHTLRSPPELVHANLADLELIGEALDFDEDGRYPSVLEALRYGDVSDRGDVPSCELACAVTRVRGDLMIAADKEGDTGREVLRQWQHLVAQPSAGAAFADLAELRVLIETHAPYPAGAIALNDWGCDDSTPLGRVWCCAAAPDPEVVRCRAVYMAAEAAWRGCAAEDDEYHRDMMIEADMRLDAAVIAAVVAYCAE